jgi:hypothetical protein
MKWLNQFTLGIIGIFALFLFISTPLKAQQHMSGQDQSQHMGDENLMNDPEMKKHMDEMHQNMNTMVNGMDGMIHTLEQVQNPDKKQ